MMDRDPIEQLKTALRWTADYYDEPMREAGCPCDASSGITCPLHAGLAVLPLVGESTSEGSVSVNPERKDEWGWARFNETTGSLSWNYRTAAEHPDRCVCQGDDPTPHKHYSDGNHACARCSACQSYRPAVLSVRQPQEETTEIRGHLAALSPSVGEATSEGSVSLEGPFVGCMDCGLPYEQFPLDMLFPRPQWLEIHPEENGLLCAQCMVTRASMVPGATVVHAVIEIAPHRSVRQPQEETTATSRRTSRDPLGGTMDKQASSIEQLIGKWRAEVADMRSRHGGQAVPRVLELCADELESLLGSARLQKEDVEHLVRWLERERAGVDHHHYCSWRQVVEKTLNNLSALITPSVGESMESYKENKDGER